MTELEACDALVTEVLMAWRFATEGERLCGAHLLRWRQLPAKERAYFTALVAPLVDEHYATRTSNVVTQDDGSCTVTYDPPFPEPCGCARPVWVDGESGSTRCTRCLRAWSMRQEVLREYLSKTTLPLVRQLAAISREDMGYAIEHVLTSPFSP